MGLLRGLNELIFIKCLEQQLAHDMHPVSAFVIVAFSTPLLAKLLFSWTTRVENPLIPQSGHKSLADFWETIHLFV